MMANHKSIKFIVCLPIWGDRFIHRAERYLFSSILSEKSLTSLRQSSKFKFIFYTDKKSSEKLFKTLGRFGLRRIEYDVLTIFDDKFSEIEHKYKNKKYDRVTLAQKQAINIALEEKFDYVVPLYGDFIVQENFLLKLREVMSQNTDFFLTIVPAVVSEEAEPLLNSRQNEDPITYETCFSIMQKCVHPLFYHSIFGFGKNFYPLGPYIGLGTKECFCVRSLHYHPLFMRIYHGTDYDFRGTIDGDFIPSLPLNPLNTIFNKTRDLLPLSLMDNDFPLQKITPADHVDHYRNAITAFSHPNTTKFFLSHSNKFNFSDHEFPEELSERLDNFCNLAMTKVTHSQTTSASITTKNLKLMIKYIVLFCKRIIVRTTSQKFRITIKKYLTKSSNNKPRRRH